MSIYNGTAAAAQTIIFWGAQAESGVATDYIATTSAAVSVGPVSGLPRLDYLNSTCPRLLLEPQRTNLLTSSEDFNSWTLIGGGSVTSNSTTSPDGYANADTIEPLGYARRLFTMASGSNTFSIYLKAKDTNCIVRVGFLGTGDISLIDSQSTITTSGWTRVTITYTNATAPLGVYFNIQSGDNDVYAWGAQVEAGAYVTSYIPTLGTSVTRVADAASKTGISSLIGQTEGTLFCDVKLDVRSGNPYFAIAPDLSSTQNYIGIGFLLTTIVFEVVIGGSLAMGITFNNSTAGRFKIAVAYKQNDFAMYVNGVQVGVSTSGNVIGCSQFGIFEYTALNSLNYNQALLFKTRLTNESLASLTSL
jgi:hypothetical protein